MSSITRLIKATPKDEQDKEKHRLNVLIALQVSLQGLDAVGELIVQDGLKCGRANCEPVTGSLTDESTFHLGVLIRELAGIAEHCREELEVLK